MSRCVDNGIIKYVTTINNYLFVFISGNYMATFFEERLVIFRPVRGTKM